jgi:16S rRNA (adenine1518-N6/adenine1519-N6)-dimethyltransferase
MIDYSKIYSVSYIKELLEKLDAAMLRSLGQNFIISESLIDKIISASGIDKDDNVVEIGPGLGVLSHKIKEKAKSLLAIEKDKKFYGLLVDCLGDANTKIIHADATKIDSRLLPKKYSLVSNLPFNVANHIIRIFLEADFKPEMTLLVQKEVAQRMIAKPNDANLLSNSIAFYADAKIEFLVSRDNFWPKPHVDCAVVKITPHKNQYDKNFSKLFFKILKAGFSHPRKQLLNNFSVGLKMNREQVGEWMEKSKINSQRRAETLTLNEWIELTKNL